MITAARDGRTIGFRESGVTLIARLIYAEGRPLATRELLLTLEESGNGITEDALYNRIHQTRRRLYPADPHGVIVRDASGYRLNLDVILLDSLLMEQLYRAAQVALDLDNQEQVADAYEKILALYRGPYLEGCADNESFPLEHRRVALSQWFRHAVCFMARLAANLGHLHRAIQLCDRGLSQEPLSEEIVQVLLPLLSKRSSTSARSFYRHYDTECRRQLGIPPSQCVVRLAQSLALLD